MTPQLGALVLRHFDRHMAEGLATVHAAMKLKVRFLLRPPLPRRWRGGGSGLTGSESGRSRHLQERRRRVDVPAQGRHIHVREEEPGARPQDQCCRDGDAGLMRRRRVWRRGTWAPAGHLVRYLACN